MFEKAKVFGEVYNKEFQFLKKLNLAIPMFGKANLQCLEKPHCLEKFIIKNSNVWKNQNSEFKC